MSEDKNDNVEYFPGKPGFYKKGQCQFKLTFGSLEDLLFSSEVDPEDKKKERHLRSVSNEEQSNK